MTPGCLANLRLKIPNNQPPLKFARRLANHFLPSRFSDEVFFADPRARKPWNVVAGWVGMKASELEKPFTARGGSERDAEMDARTNL